MQGVVSIQSQVVYGHVGNSAAQFALQCLGFEVWAVPTVLFSNHPGYGGFVGAPFPAHGLSSLIGGLAARGLFSGTLAVLSGYLGAPEQVDSVLIAVTAARKANPDALFCCDPVMGDADKGTYVRDGIPDRIARDLLPLADILTPNAYELGQLCGRSVRDPCDARDAARSLNCPLTVVTSVPLPDRPGEIGTLAVTPERAWLCTTTRLDHVPPGTGDLFSALFLGRRLAGCTVPDALNKAAAGVDAVLKKTRSASEDGALDMALIDARTALTADTARPA